MPLFALGLNHRSAPLAVREQIVFAPDRIGGALQELMHVAAVNEAAIVSTCNRTEVYCHLEDDDHAAALQWFVGQHGIVDESVDDFLYRHVDHKTVRHLLRVACGLDSMVLGETQILGQLKAAYRQAEQAGTLGRQLGKLFQYAFTVAKQVRSTTAISANPVSVAFAAVRCAQRIFADLSQQTALLVGAGETIERVAQHLQSQGMQRLIIANRSLQRATALATQYKAEAIRLAELNQHLFRADIVVSSTASQRPIIGKGAVESAIKQRKHRPIFMVDIAVPRDIEPEVGLLPDVYLSNIDDLEVIVEENRRSRANAADQAELIVASKVEEFIAWQRSLGAVDAIRHYRTTADGMREAALAKAQRLLAQGKNPDDVLQFLAHTLTNKLLHHTTSRLHDAARAGRDDVVEVVNELFTLNTDDREQ